MHRWQIGRGSCTGVLVLSSRCVTTSVACVAGTGSFGRVKLVRSSTDGRFYALKVLRKTDLLRLKQVRAVVSPMAGSQTHPMPSLRTALPLPRSNPGPR